MSKLTSRSSTNTLCKAISYQQNVIARHSHAEVKPKKWARWQDVPDEWVLKNARAPDRPLYQTQKYRNFKKQQIFYQQEHDTPVWLCRGYPYNYLYWVYGALFIYVTYGTIKALVETDYIFPKKKKQ